MPETNFDPIAATELERAEVRYELYLSRPPCALGADGGLLEMSLDAFGALCVQIEKLKERVALERHVAES